MGLLVLFIAGMLVLGGLCVIAGAVWHEEVEALPRLLIPARGAHTAPHGILQPDPEPWLDTRPEPPAQRYSRLLAADPIDYGRPLDTPPDGIPAVGTGGFAPIVQTDDRPPWDIETGSFPVVADQDADQDAEQERASYVREHLPECTATPEVLERVHAGLKRGAHPYANGWL